MRNKVVKKLLIIAMAVTMISGTSIATVYANANPPAEETTTAVVEETTTEKNKDTEKAEDTGRVTGESNNSAFSTPGNAQLVDDKENDDTKQFLTIQTKKGNTFYMVIDRSSNTENVYMIPEEERRRFQTAREVIGKCPVCGCDVFEGKQNFYCSNRQCDFALWKENRFLGSMEKNLDKKMARELLDKACTHVKGLYSKKKDMKFDADLLLTLEDGKPRFHLEFPKKKKK